MDILQILEQAKAQIKAEEERQVQIIKQQVVQEVAPKNQEIEQLKAEAINSLTVEYSNTRNAIIEQQNKQLAVLQEKFENDKNAVCENAEKKKTEMFNSALANATYEITRDCEKAISKLDAQIKEIKE